VTADYFDEGKHRYMSNRDETFAEYVYSLVDRITEGEWRRFDTAFELGAGVGRFSTALVSRFETVHLVEPSAGFASVLRDRFGGDGVVVHEKTAGEFCRERTVEGGAVCFGFHILHHLSPEERREVFAFLRETAMPAVFVEPNPWNPLILIQILMNSDMKMAEEKGYLKLRRHARLCLIPPFILNVLLHSFLGGGVRRLEWLGRILPPASAYQLFWCGPG
jgi:hypothetical protein